MTLKPRYVRPKVAAPLVPCGMTRLYELINEGLLETKHDGTATLVSVASIERYQDNLPSAKPRPAPYAALSPRRKKATQREPAHAA